MQKYIDIHTHSTYKRADVLSILNISCSDYVSGQYKGCLSAGVHPWEVKERDVDFYKERLVKCLQDIDIVAIGECGIDKTKNIENLELQKDVFRMQLELAQELGLPVILHIVRAYSELEHLIKECSLTVPLILHSYRAKATITDQMLKYRNINLSIGSSLCNNTEKLRSLLDFIPTDRLFFETDDTDIPIERIYAESAAVLSISLVELQRIVSSNFDRIFGLGNVCR